MKNTPPQVSRAYLNDVVLAYTGDECLIWPFRRNAEGYAKIGAKRVHRVVCEKIHGPPPTKDHRAIHSCGKGQLGCVSPGHVRWGTATENNIDSVLHGTSQAKLTKDDVLKIKALLNQGEPQVKIAEMFDVNFRTISSIATGRRWSWLNVEL